VKSSVLRQSCNGRMYSSMQSIKIFFRDFLRMKPVQNDTARVWPLPPVSDGGGHEMSGEKIPHGTWQEKLIAEARQRENEREKGYRAQALKIHPPICARCGREFGGKKLRDLTVHHRYHNHENNPSDGSNWELLCLY